MNYSEHNICVTLFFELSQFADSKYRVEYEELLCSEGLPSPFHIERMRKCATASKKRGFLLELVFWRKVLIFSTHCAIVVARVVVW